MTEEDRKCIDTLIFLGCFDAALDLMQKHGEKDSRNPELLLLFAKLREKLAAAEQAEKEPVDHGFFELMEKIASLSEDEIFNMILRNYINAPQQTQMGLAVYLTAFQSLNLWGKLDPPNNDYEDFRLRARIIKNHCEDLMWLHERLADNRSKNVLYAVLSNWVNMRYDAVDAYRERVYPEYFDPVIFPRRSDEVFVDLGASSGDSAVLFYYAHLCRYKHIYCYEITPATYKILSENIEGIPNVSLRQKAAWSSPGFMYLKECPAGESANQVGEQGGIPIETVRIDDDISEPVTFIKMDIEGAEVEALRGCERQIRENHPKLAICTYHGYEHIYAVPRLIDKIAPGYKFFMRYHDNNDVIPMATEYSLLAVWEEAK